MKKYIHYIDKRMPLCSGEPVISGGMFGPNPFITTDPQKVTCPHCSHVFAGNTRESFYDTPSDYTAERMESLYFSLMDRLKRYPDHIGVEVLRRCISSIEG